MGSHEETSPIYRETRTRFRVLRQITEVRQTGVYVRLAPFHQSFRHIPASEIDEVTVTSYSATSYGGWYWGVRRSLSGNIVYRLGGDRGVELVLHDGKKIFWEFDRGQSNRRHRQREQEEFYFVLDGQFEMEVDGDRFTIEAGDSVLVSPDSWRQLTALDDGTVLVVGAPSVKDDAIHGGEENT